MVYTYVKEYVPSKIPFALIWNESIGNSESLTRCKYYLQEFKPDINMHICERNPKSIVKVGPWAFTRNAFTCNRWRGCTLSKNRSPTPASHRRQGSSCCTYCRLTYRTITSCIDWQDALFYYGWIHQTVMSIITEISGIPKDCRLQFQKCPSSCFRWQFQIGKSFNFVKELVEFDMCYLLFVTVT